MDDVNTKVRVYVNLRLWEKALLLEEYNHHRKTNTSLSLTEFIFGRLLSDWQQKKEHGVMLVKEGYLTSVGSVKNTVGYQFHRGELSINHFTPEFRQKSELALQAKREQVLKSRGMTVDYTLFRQCSKLLQWLSKDEFSDLGVLYNRATPVSITELLSMSSYVVDAEKKDGVDTVSSTRPLYVPAYSVNRMKLKRRFEWYGRVRSSVRVRVYPQSMLYYEKTLQGQLYRWLLPSRGVLGDVVSCVPDAYRQFQSSGVMSTCPKCQLLYPVKRVKGQYDYLYHGSCSWQPYPLSESMSIFVLEQKRQKRPLLPVRQLHERRVLRPFYTVTKPIPYPTAHLHTNVNVGNRNQQELSRDVLLTNTESVAEQTTTKQDGDSSSSMLAYPDSDKMVAELQSLRQNTVLLSSYNKTVSGKKKSVFVKGSKV